MNDNSILTTIKHMIGIDESYETFDIDVINGINMAMMALNQLGVGKKNFVIRDKTSKWEDFVDLSRFPSVVDYIYLKVKLVFDSSTSSGVYINTINEMIKELEFRLNVESETPLSDLEEE